MVRKELDMTERLSLYSLALIYETNTSVTTTQVKKQMFSSTLEAPV